MRIQTSDSQKEMIKRECHRMWVEYGLLPEKLEARIFQIMELNIPPIPPFPLPDVYVDHWIGFVRNECITYAELRKIDSRTVFTSKSSLNKPMDPELFATRMLDIFNLAKEDEEAAHMDADSLLVELLYSFGYEKGCHIFENMPKWYA